MRVIRQLKQLYNEIRDCHICPGMDPKKVLRSVDAVDISSDVFILSQALARGQLRRSGINFFDADGRLGGTGRRLEDFLNKFGRKVYPSRSTLTLEGRLVPKARLDLISVYNSELVHCYPGKRGRGDRSPSET